jgi:hypothetical protein
MLGWLDRYEEALGLLLAGAPGGGAQTATDACFAALRLQQRTRWPEGAPLVDMLGLAANELLIAWSEEGLGSERAVRAQAQHAQCVVLLRQALAPTPGVPA